MGWRIWSVRQEDAVQRLKGLLAGGARQLTLDDANIRDGRSPLPETGVPFLFAGWSDVSLRREARLGDGWIGCAAEAFSTGMCLPVHIDASG